MNLVSPGSLYWEKFDLKLDSLSFLTLMTKLQWCTPFQGSPYGQSKNWGSVFCPTPSQRLHKVLRAARGHSPPTSPNFIAYDWNYFPTLYMKIFSSILKKQVLAHWLEVSACI